MLAEPATLERQHPDALDDRISDVMTLDPVAWVEEPARIVIARDAGEVHSARFEVTAPADLARVAVGRPAEELPRLLPALSSVSAVAHHLASARALDQVFGVTPPPAGQALRRALLLADFIRAHQRRLALLLAAPESPLAPAPRRYWPAPRHSVSPAFIGDLMRGAALAQEAMEIIGGRVGLPVFAVPGGVARAIDGRGRDRLATVAASLLEFAHRAQTVLHGSLNTRSEWQAFFNGEAFSLPMASLALFGERGGVDWLGESVHIVAPDGTEIARSSPAEHADTMAEHTEPWSHLPFVHLKAHAWPGLDSEQATGLFRVGPLARLNASGHPLSGEELTERVQLVETHSLAASVWAGLIEWLDASEMLATLSRDEVLAGNEVRSLPTRTQAVGEGAAAVEGPAGLVLHAYRTDTRGIVRQARILDPAAFNNAARNLTAQKVARHVLKHSGRDEGELRLIEFAVAAC